MASKAVLLVKVIEAMDGLDSREEQDLLNKAIINIPEKFRDDFRKLANDMKVDNIEFLAYWETDESCQNVFRELMQRRINEIEKVVGAMKELIY